MLEHLEKSYCDNLYNLDGNNFDEFHIGGVCIENFILVELVLMIIQVLLPGGERGAPSCRSSCVSTHWEGKGF